MYKTANNLQMTMNDVEDVHDIFLPLTTVSLHLNLFNNDMSSLLGSRNIQLNLAGGT